MCGLVMSHNKDGYALVCFYQDDVPSFVTVPISELKAQKSKDFEKSLMKVLEKYAAAWKEVSAQKKKKAK